MSVSTKKSSLKTPGTTINNRKNITFNSNARVKIIDDDTETEEVVSDKLSCERYKNLKNWIQDKYFLKLLPSYDEYQTFLSKHKVNESDMKRCMRYFGATIPNPPTGDESSMPFTLKTRIQNFVYYVKVNHEEKTAEGVKWRCTLLQPTDGVRMDHTFQHPPKNELDKEFWKHLQQRKQPHKDAECQQEAKDALSALEDEIRVLSTQPSTKILTPTTGPLKPSKELLETSPQKKTSPPTPQEETPTSPPPPPSNPSAPPTSKTSKPSGDLVVGTHFRSIIKWKIHKPWSFWSSDYTVHDTKDVQTNDQEQVLGVIHEISENEGYTILLYLIESDDQYPRLKPLYFKTRYTPYFVLQRDNSLWNNIRDDDIIVESDDNPRLGKVPVTLSDDDSSFYEALYDALENRNRLQSVCEKISVSRTLTKSGFAKAIETYVRKNSLLPTIGESSSLETALGSWKILKVPGDGNCMAYVLAEIKHLWSSNQASVNVPVPKQLSKDNATNANKLRNEIANFLSGKSNNPDYIGTVTHTHVSDTKMPLTLDDIPFRLQQKDKSAQYIWNAANDADKKMIQQLRWERFVQEKVRPEKEWLDETAIRAFQALNPSVPLYAVEWYGEQLTNIHGTADKPNPQLQVGMIRRDKNHYDLIILPDQNEQTDAATIMDKVATLLSDVGIVLEIKKDKTENKFLYNLDTQRIVLLKTANNKYKSYLFPKEQFTVVEGGGKKTRRRRLPKNKNTRHHTIALRRR